MSAFFEEKVKAPVMKLLKSGGVWHVYLQLLRLIPVFLVVDTGAFAFP